MSSRKCVVCGKWYDPSVDGKHGLAPGGGFMLDFEYCSWECSRYAESQRNSGRGDGGAAAAAAAEAMAESARQAARAQEESDKNAAGRQAWPPFEEKYGKYFA
ncbi:MAG: hypothetical protein LBC88_04650, partial [Spirochaetaceae bacterium]|nr:hypothetical protein [Spirochaetaceae bacterium]